MKSQDVPADSEFKACEILTEESGFSTWHNPNYASWAQPVTEVYMPSLPAAVRAVPSLGLKALSWRQVRLTLHKSSFTIARFL